MGAAQESIGMFSTQPIISAEPASSIIEGTSRPRMEELSDAQRPLTLGDKLTAVYFGIPPSNVRRLPAEDWTAHKAVVGFVVAIVLPLSAVSFGHLATLVLASGGATAWFSTSQLYWVVAVGGALFGMLITWLNDSGMTIMLRRRAESWQKLVGLATRGLFIALNVVLFTAAITAFGLRDRIELKRNDARVQDVKARTSSDEQRNERLSGTLVGLQESLAARTNDLETDPPRVVSLRKAALSCSKAETAATERQARLRADLEALEGQAKQLLAVDRTDYLRRRAKADQELTQQQLEVTQIKARCRLLSKQLDDEIETYRTNVRTSIEMLQQQVKINDDALVESRKSMQSGKIFAENQAELGFGRNLGAEFTSLAFLIGDQNETGARLTAMVIALFFGLIDLTPVIWGWSLRDGGVDAFTFERARTYLRALESAEGSSKREIAADSEIQAELIDARSAEDRRLLGQRAQYETDLAAAKQYADAILKLERMLNSPAYANAGAENLGRIKREALESLSISYRRWSQRAPT
jgi:Domain of unknown function (DUF4407)